MKVLSLLLVSLFLSSSLPFLWTNTYGTSVASSAVATRDGCSLASQVTGDSGYSRTAVGNQVIASFQGNVESLSQEARPIVSASASANSTLFTRHVMCKDHDIYYNPVDPTTVFSPSDTKAECLTTASINNTIEFRWFYRSNSSMDWISCYNWSESSLFAGEYDYAGYLLIEGYWPGTYYPRAYKVEVYLDSFMAFQEFFEVTNGGFSSPRTCEGVGSNGLPLDLKSRFTIGTDAKAYCYLSFDNLAYFNEELGCCHNVTTAWIQPDGSTYETFTDIFSDYKQTNVTWNSWASGHIADDYVLINAATPVGNWKVEVYLDEYYFNGTWKAYGPVSTTPFVVGSQPVADWTVMMYLDADNSLESAAIDTFLNIASVGSSSQVSIVAQMDRIGIDDRYGNWTDCKRFYITQGMTPSSENAIQDLGEVNMGDPETLKDFANWTMNNYPANRYFLVLWDHGAGFMGICFDATNGGKALSLPDLSQALSGLPAIVDVVLTDACSTNMIETAYQIRDFANVLIGPEDLGYEPAPYQNYFSDLMKNATISPTAFAKTIVTDYMTWCLSALNIQNATMSATDLTRITSLVVAVDDFALELKEKETPFHEQISQARSQTEGYQGPYAGQTGNFIDLYNFAQLIKQYVPDEELQNAASSLTDALSTGNLIIANADKAHPNSHGLSVFYPEENQQYLTFDDTYKSTSFAEDTLWATFVENDLQGFVLTIQTHQPRTSIELDNDSYQTDDSGQVNLFVSLDYHVVNVTTIIPNGPNSRDVFAKWNDSATLNPRTIFVNETMALSAEYETQYALLTDTNPAGLSPPPQVSPQGPWYNADSFVICTAQNVSGKVFDHWSIKSLTTNQSSNWEQGMTQVNVTMNDPYEAVAYYTSPLPWWVAVFNTTGMQISLLFAGAILCVSIGRVIWIRTRKAKGGAEPAAKPPAPGPTPILPCRSSTGFQDLDNLLFGGIPENYAVALTSVSCDERDMLIRRFLEAGIEKNEITFCVTSDPSSIKALAGQSKFYLFICNPRADTIIGDLPNVFKLNSVENLNEINIALTKAFRTLDASEKTPRRACIEIVSDVLLQHHAVQTRRWLADLIPDLKSKGFTTLAVMNPQMHTPQEVQALLDLFEGEIEISEKETEGVPRKYLKIRKMLNQKYLDYELPLVKDKLEK